MVEFKIMDYVVRAEARRDLLEEEFNETTTLYFLNTLANVLRHEADRVDANGLGLLADWFKEQAGALHDICESKGLYDDQNKEREADK